MRSTGRLGFAIQSSEIRNDIYVPRYYDPDIDGQLASLAKTHDLYTLAELIEVGELELRQGNYVAKAHYGTGNVPYIRTSDIANWELRAAPKHGVSESVQAEFEAKQDVRAMDILLVHEGSYLIGTPCLITPHDTNILFQHHLAKLRVLGGERISALLLISAFLAPIVQQQIRAKQFTADIIDSIVGRLPEVKVPIPKDRERRTVIEERASAIFVGRADARVKLAICMRGVEDALRSGSTDQLEKDIAAPPPGSTSLMSFLGERGAAQAFVMASGRVRNDVLIPRYYDPLIERELASLAERCDLVSVGELIALGKVALQTGDEIGRLSYGSGDVPFVRTSDFGNWELKHDPKQRVSLEVFEEFAVHQNIAAGDVLVVRDGTYLVGTTTIVVEDDLPMLISGGIYRIRSLDPAYLPPNFMLAIFNMPAVWRQLKSKQFTRDVIDTIGHRLEEVRLPIPKDPSLTSRLAQLTGGLMEARRVLRHAATTLGAEMESDPSAELQPLAS